MAPRKDWWSGILHHGLTGAFLKNVFIKQTFTLWSEAPPPTEEINPEWSQDGVFNIFLAFVMFGFW